MKPECTDDDVGVFSPETRALIKGLGDSPESLQLKAEILNAANGLRRGQPGFYSYVAYAMDVDTVFQMLTMKS